MRKHLSFVLALILCLGVVFSQPFEVKAQGFSDTSNHWAKEYIDWASNAGYIQGYEDGTFRPEEPITRAEYYRITNQSTPETLLNTPQLNTPPKGSFSDVKPNAWYADEVTKGLQIGYLDAPADGNGVLNPDEPITREDAMYILTYNQGWSSTSPAAYDFLDSDKIGADKIGYIGGAIEQRVVNGYPDGTLKPKNYLTRAEVVTMVTKYKRGIEEDRSQQFNKRPLENWFWSITNDLYTFDLGYFINESQASKIMSQFNASDSRTILEPNNGNWEGSCFGFATTVGLYNSYLFDVSDLNASGTSIISEIQNDGSYNPQSIINAFQSTWDTASFQAFLSTHAHVWGVREMAECNNSQSIDHTFNEVKAYLDRFKGDGSMPIIGVYWMDDGKLAGHAISAYDYQINGDKLEVFVYDPNHIAKSIVIDKGTGRIYGEDFMINADYGGHDLIDFNCFLIFDTMGYNKAFKENLTSVNRYLTPNSAGKLSLTHASGDKYVADDGYDFSFTVNPDSGTRTYALRPDGEYRISSFRDEIDFEVVGQGQRLAVASNGQDEVIVNDEHLEIKGQSGDYSLSITTNDRKPWGDTIKVEGNSAGDISVETHDEDLTIKGDNLKDVVVTKYDVDDSSRLNLNTDSNEVVIKADDDDLVVVGDNHNNNPDSEVEDHKQLVDDEYVDSDLNDPLVGTWYGQGAFDTDDGDSFYVDQYLYITKVPGSYDSYKIVNRLIKQSDPGSEYFTESEGYYDPDEGILYVEKSHRCYGQTGEFVGLDLITYKGQWYIEGNGTHLSWYKPGNENIYVDKY